MSKTCLRCGLRKAHDPHDTYCVVCREQAAVLEKKLSEPKRSDDTIKGHSGNKYVRKIRSCITREVIGEVDIYSVAEAFAVEDMPLNHAAKKILCAGIRDKGSKIQDLKEAIDAIREQIKLEEAKCREPGSSSTATSCAGAPSMSCTGSEAAASAPE